MTEKQKKFCQEYVADVDLDAARAAQRAGYKCESANAAASRLFKNPEVRAYVAELLDDRTGEMIANQDEVLRFLSSIMRGQDSVIVENGRVVAHRDRIRAAELLAKRYGLLSEKAADITPVVISGAEDLVD